MEEEMETETSEDSKLIDGKEKKSNTVHGVLHSQLYCLGKTGSAVSTQFLKRTIPDLELNAFRSGFPLLLTALILLARKSLPKIPREQRRHLAMLCAINFIGNMLLFPAYSMIPVGNASALSRGFTLIFGLFVFRCILGEKINCVKCFSVIFCVIGTFFILQPHFYVFDYLFHNNIQTNFSDSTNKTLDLLLNHGFSDTGHPIGYILIALFGFTQSFSISVSTQLLNSIDIDEYIWNIVFWEYLTQCFFSVVLSLIFETPVLPPSWSDWGFVCLHAASYATIWPFRLLSNAILSATKFNIIVNMYIVYMTACQYTILRVWMPGHENWQEVLGLFIILFISIINGII